MSPRISLACAVLALCGGVILAPTAHAMDNADGMAKSSGAMMHKGGMKKHKKHMNSMMHDPMTKDAAPQQ